MTRSNPFNGVEACVFDAYGTLLDVHSATEKERAALGERTGALSELWRAKQLQYSWLRALMGIYAPFWEITGEALDYAMETVGVNDPALRLRLMQLYLELAPFPEVPAVLRALRNAGFKTAILTNGSKDMIRAGCESAGIVELFDAILSVEDLNIFKPHPSVYQHAVDWLGIPRERIAYLSSNGWDAAGAAQFGFRVAWCNRYAQQPERLPSSPQVVIRSLEELPFLLERAAPSN